MENLYEPLDFYMLRTPTYSVNFYNEISEITNNEEMLDYILNVILTDEKIIEMIKVASSNLYEALIRLKSNPQTKKKEQIILNLVKYLIRMSTRATPFGLFSGISVGKFGERTNIQIADLDSFVKIARPDMGWILGFIKNFESDVDNVKYLKVEMNHLAVVHGVRVNLPYITQYGERSKSEEKEVMSSSINFNEVTQKVFDFASKPIVFSELLTLIKNEYLEVEEEKIQDFLLSLLKNEYLISDLRPPLTNGSPFEYIIDKLSGISEFNQIYAKLVNLKKELDIYNNLPIGRGNDLLNKINGDMKEIFEVDTPLQIDLLIKTKNNTINKSIQQDLAKVAEFLWRLTPKENRSTLDSYGIDFLEKYGEYREVSVLELLDPDRGLGAPAGYLNPISYKKLDNVKPDNINKLEDYILDRISKSSINNTEGIFEINIEDDFRATDIDEQTDFKNASVSMELYFNIIAQSAEEIDKGNYHLQLIPNTGSDAAGKTFGRFMSLLKDDEKKDIYRINEIEKSFYEDTIFAEMVYLPDFGRSANVSITESIRDYELSIGTTSSKEEKYTLKMSDLVIGLHQGKFYIRSKSLNKRVIITMGHMLNITGYHNVCRFLKEVSNHGMISWKFPHFSWMSKMPFIPRIRLGKIIIMPATWNLSLNLLQAEINLMKEDFHYFKKQFNRCCLDLKVPRYVYLIDMDNKVLLDTKNDIHLQIIRKEMIKKEDHKLQFSEFGNTVNEEWIKGEPDSYLSEIVVPFVKNNIDNEKIKINLNYRNSDALNEIREKAPGSDWLYFRIYCNSRLEDEIIGNNLREICNKVIFEGLADKYFFIRYADNKKHIRLRFNIGNRNNYANLLFYMNEQMELLKKKGLISNAIIDVYDREIERYGGPKLIDDAECLFFYDSKFVQELVKLKEDNLLKNSFQNICIFSILNYLDQFGLTYEQQFNLLNKIVDRKEYLQDFRKDKKQLIELGKKRDIFDFCSNESDNNNLQKLLNDRGKEIKSYKKKIDILEENEGISNSKEDIILSVLHLHCNRMIGVDRDYEKKLYTIARHTLKALNYYITQKEEVLLV